LLSKITRKSECFAMVTVCLCDGLHSVPKLVGGANRTSPRREQDVPKQTRRFGQQSAERSSIAGLLTKSLRYQGSAERSVSGSLREENQDPRSAGIWSGPVHRHDVWTVFPVQRRGLRRWTNRVGIGEGIASEAARVTRVGTPSLLLGLHYCTRRSPSRQARR
jgi:hypothetical protein